MSKLLCFSFAGAAAQYYEPESSFISKFTRQFFPGGPRAISAPKAGFNSTNNPYAFRGPIITHPDGLKEQTLMGPPLRLKGGEIVNNYMPLNWPEGKVHLKSYSGDIWKLAPGANISDIGPDGFPNVTQASREEVYLHHWTLNKWQMGKEAYDAFCEQGRDFKDVGADAGQTHGGNGPCGMILLHFLFGAGNEVRGPPPSGENATYSFPDPYGIESDADDMHENGILMLLNTHIIDIRGVDNVRGCTECDCKVTGITPHARDTGLPLYNYTGGLECCHSTVGEGAVCPSTGTESQYYFVRYTITWREPSDAVYSDAPFKPLNAMILDQSDDGKQWYDPVPFPGTSKQEHLLLHDDPVSMASLTGLHSGMRNEDGHIAGIKIDAGLFPKPHIKPRIDFDTHGCHVEYYVPECKKGDLCQHRFRNDWKIPYDMEIVALHSHVHNGAINMTTSVIGGGDICIGHPVYKDGFLVETSKCVLGKNMPDPFQVKKGQHIKVETFYNQDDQPHYGVMGYSMIYSHRLDLKDPEKAIMV
jgi:hypothetical protein